MAINKKLIHFKKFSDFNSKKLSANEDNTKYTVGVGETVITGAPDVLYQSICWIKDTKQQWTHGELYDCDMGDVNPYVAFFTLDEIQQLAESGESRQIDQEDYMGILDAVESGRPILIPNGYAAGGYATVVNKSIDDCIYLTVVGDVSGGVPRFYALDVWEGEVLATEITYQQALVSGQNIKTVNGESLLGSGNLNVTPYIAPFVLSDVFDNLETRDQIVIGDAEYEELLAAVNSNVPIVIYNNYTQSGYAYVVNRYVEDLMYLTVIADLDSGYARFIAIEIEKTSGNHNMLAYERTYQPNLVSGTNIKTINGESILGSGDITISGGSSFGDSGAYAEIQHGTSDTTFDLTPNTFHVWDEVASLTLAFDVQTIGIANEFLFQFTSGSTATTLSLPDDIKWANDNAPTIEANKIYQVSILNGLGSVMSWSDSNLIQFTILYAASLTANFECEKGMTWEDFVGSAYNTDSSVFIYNSSVGYKSYLIQNVTPTSVIENGAVYTGIYDD